MQDNPHGSAPTPPPFPSGNPQYADGHYINPNLLPPAAATQPASAPASRGTRTALKVALVGAGVVAGAIGASAIGASASTSGSGSASTSAYSANVAATTAANGSTSGSSAPAGMPGNGTGGPGGHMPGGPGGQNPNEKLVTDATLKAKLTAAAQAAVPGATVDKVETDSGDAKYEVHMTKTDGSRVTVKFDANGTKTAVEDGMGK